MSSKPRKPPKGAHWVEQVLNRQILLEPDGVVFSKISNVERQASEGLLLSKAKLYGLKVARFGTHYLIYRPGATMTPLI